MIKKIVSGGQTGVDRAALDYAIENNFPHGGWCPRGRVAEDGELALQYILQVPTDRDLAEPSANIYDERTKLNIRDSDATLILVPKLPLPTTITDGTNLTIKEVQEKNKSYLMIDLSNIPPLEEIHNWIESNNIKILNIAGPRESQSVGIYKSAFNFLKVLLKIYV